MVFISDPRRIHFLLINLLLYTVLAFSYVPLLLMITIIKVVVVIMILIITLTEVSNNYDRYGNNNHSDKFMIIYQIFKTSG